MNTTDSKERANRNILWLLLGTFLIPTINGLEGLSNGFLKALDLSFTARLVTSITFDSIIILGLISAMFLILRKGTGSFMEIFEMELDKFKLFGFIMFVVIISGRLANYYLVTDTTNEMRHLESNARYDLLQESGYFYLTQVVLTTARDLFVFLFYFVAIFKIKK